MSVNYSLKLISRYNIITLPATIQNLKSIKIKKLMYRFISMDQYVFTVNIATWNSNIHFDGVVQYNYTLCNYILSIFEHFFTHYWGKGMEKGSSKYTKRKKAFPFNF